MHSYFILNINSSDDELASQSLASNVVALVLIVYYMVYETIFPDNCLKVGDGEKVKISCLHKPGSLIKITEVKYGDKHDDLFYP
jgi:hypothetical protein